MFSGHLTSTRFDKFHYPSDGKDAVVDTSSSTLGKVGDSVKGGMQSVGNGLSNVGEYIGDKYEGNKTNQII